MPRRHALVQSGGGKSSRGCLFLSDPNLHQVYKDQHVISELCAQCTEPQQQAPPCHLFQCSMWWGTLVPRSSDQPYPHTLSETFCSLCGSNYATHRFQECYCPINGKWPLKPVLIIKKKKYQCKQNIPKAKIYQQCDPIARKFHVMSIHFMHKFRILSKIDLCFSLNNIKFCD